MGCNKYSRWVAFTKSKNVTGPLVIDQSPDILERIETTIWFVGASNPDFERAFELINNKAQ